MAVVCLQFIILLDSIQFLESCANEATQSLLPVSDPHAGSGYVNHCSACMFTQPVLGGFTIQIRSKGLFRGTGVHAQSSLSMMLLLLVQLDLRHSIVSTYTPSGNKKAFSNE